MREDAGDEIVQINHPRLPKANPVSGYSDGRMNRETSEIAYPFFETDFDQVKTFNALIDSPNGHVGRTALVEQKLKDWFNLLNRPDDWSGKHRCPRVPKHWLHHGASRLSS